MPPPVARPPPPQPPPPPPKCIRRMAYECTSDRSSLAPSCHQARPSCQLNTEATCSSEACPSVRTPLCYYEPTRPAQKEANAHPVGGSAIAIGARRDRACRVP
jgi:hypothetical protein